MHFMQTRREEKEELLWSLETTMLLFSTLALERIKYISIHLFYLPGPLIPFKSIECQFKFVLLKNI